MIVALPGLFSYLVFGRRCRLKHFNMADVAAVLDIETEQFNQFRICMSP